MSDQYVADDERDAILDRLLTVPDNKVSQGFWLRSHLVGLFWLQEQESKVGFLQHRHIPMLSVHVSP